MSTAWGAVEELILSIMAECDDNGCHSRGTEVLCGGEFVAGLSKQFCAWRVCRRDYVRTSPRLVIREVPGIG